MTTPNVGAGGGATGTTAASLQASLGQSQGTGLFAEQAPRLLRTKWPDANMLAQELYAIFNSIQDTAGTAKPIAWNAPGNPNTPSQQFKGFGPSQPLFTFQQPNGPIIALTPSGFTADGTPIPGLEFPTDTNPSAQFPNFPPANTPQKQNGSGQGGVVVSGSGEDYQVQLFSSSASADAVSNAISQFNNAVNNASAASTGSSPPGVVSATAPGVATNDAVPPGTFVILVKIGSTYYFQAPIWLD